MENYWQHHRGEPENRVGRQELALFGFCHGVVVWLCSLSRYFECVTLSVVRYRSVRYRSRNRDDTAASRGCHQKSLGDVCATSVVISSSSRWHGCVLMGNQPTAIGLVEADSRPHPVLECRTVWMGAAAVDGGVGKTHVLSGGDFEVVKVE